MIADSFTKTDAFPFGDFALYQSGVRLALAHVFTVSNAYNYVNIAFYLLTEWKLASPFEQQVMEKILFTARTSNLRTVPKDVLVECFVMCARYFLGKTTNKALKDSLEAARPLADAASPPLNPPLMDQRDVKRKTSAQRAELATELARKRTALPALIATATVRQTAMLTVVQQPASASGEAPTLTVHAPTLGMIEPLKQPLLALHLHAPAAAQRRADSDSRVQPPSTAPTGGSLLSTEQRQAARCEQHLAMADDMEAEHRALKKAARDSRRKERESRS
jgi:hypothetical protein